MMQPWPPMGPGLRTSTPGGDVEVLRGRSKRAIRDGTLVLQSAGIPHAVVPDGAGVRVYVAAADAEQALHELADYAQENVDWPPPRGLAPPALSSGITGAAAYVAIVAAVFWIEREPLAGLDWHRAGVMHAGAVQGGELWRVVTALTMHADATHLVSNIVFGALFAAVAAQTLGAGIVWSGTLLAGALGNYVETFLVDASHRGVGASTAIFGTLGLMSAAEWVRRGAERLPWVRRAAPLYGGAVLFGWFGGGGGSERVDVLAHALGFLVGAALGFAVGRFDLSARIPPRGQTALGVLTAAAVVAAWAAAVR